MLLHPQDCCNSPSCFGAGPHRSYPPSAPPQCCPHGAAPNPEPCGCSGVPNGATQGSVLPVVPGLCLSRRECSSGDAAKAA